MHFSQQRLLTNASSFFFERDNRLFLVTSWHVVIDEPSNHFPDRIEIELHTDPGNLVSSTGFSIPLYMEGKPVWRQDVDKAFDIDVAVIEIERAALPQSAVYRAFTPDHLYAPDSLVEVGSSLLVVGFPLGFHDGLHHMSVVRHAILASAFGLCFQGQGYFITDARTHRGTSGAPVVMRAEDRGALGTSCRGCCSGLHSAQLDMRTRDQLVDEALGLNCAWSADAYRELSSALEPLGAIRAQKRCQIIFRR